MLARVYSSTVTPMLRAVPAMMFMAASTSLALRSGSFIVAISRSWSWVIEPTFTSLGSPEPFAMPVQGEGVRQRVRPSQKIARRRSERALQHDAAAATASHPHPRRGAKGAA